MKEDENKVFKETITSLFKSISDNQIDNAVENINSVFTEEFLNSLSSRVAIKSFDFNRLTLKKSCSDLYNYYVINNLRIPKNNENYYRIIFFLENYDFINNHIKNIIIRKEGTSCSSDKSRRIMKYIFDYFVENKEIVLDYDSADSIVFLPQTILKDQESILCLFNAIYRLFYGYVDEYIKLLTEYYLQ